MPVSIYSVDAFTDTIFKGNPAAVCLLHSPADEEWMQNVAAEINLSETAFVTPLAQGFGLRWFTPKVEVNLCGHATLAATHILLESGILKEDEVAEYHTKSGILRAKRSEGWIQMDFPSTFGKEIAPPPGISAAIGLEPVRVVSCNWMMLVEAGSEDEITSMKPDFDLISRLPTDGLIVTAKSGSEEYDFISRFFAPRLGINEDPVTGAAHCCLGPYWQTQSGKNDFTAYQASQRGGVLKVLVSEDRTYISGQAITVMRGVLL